MLHIKNIAGSEGFPLINLFELIEAADIATIKENIYLYDLKQLNNNGHPPIIATLFQLIDTKDALVRNDLKKLIDELISSGANPFQKDLDGSNALTWAIINKDEELIEKFDSLGLKAFQRNHFGNSAMHYWLATYKGFKLQSLQIEVEYNAYQVLHLFTYALTKLMNKDKKFHKFVK